MTALDASSYNSFGCVFLHQLWGVFLQLILGCFLTTALGLSTYKSFGCIILQHIWVCLPTTASSVSSYNNFRCVFIQQLWVCLPTTASSVSSCDSFGCVFLQSREKRVDLVASRHPRASCRCPYWAPVTTSTTWPTSTPCTEEGEETEATFKRRRTKRGQGLFHLSEKVFFGRQTKADQKMSY